MEKGKVTDTKHLGSTLMALMIREAAQVCQPGFDDEDRDYHQVNHVPSEIRLQVITRTRYHAFGMSFTLIIDSCVSDHPKLVNCKQLSVQALICLRNVVAIHLLAVHTSTDVSASELAIRSK